MAKKDDELIVTEQADRFRRIARELECDEDEAAFEERVRKVATPPKPTTEPNA